MKKLIAGIASIAMLLMVALPVLAAGKSAPKATGGYDYNVYDVDRHAEFNAIQTSATCSYAWNVSGNYVINLTYLGVDYTEYLALVQIGDSITGTSLALAGNASPWTIDSGSVTANSLNFLAYFNSSPSLQANFSATIDTNGALISGTWGDVAPGTRTGTWWSTSGNATKVATSGCTGKGTFNYSDETGLYYTLDVKYVSVEGNQAWFAGEWVSGNWGSPGTWLFIRVTDNGEPGVDDASAGDVIYSETTAKNLVAAHATPNLSGIIITGGNIQVH